MPGVDVAGFGRGLVDGVGSVLGLPNFIGCRGNLAEVVEIGEVFAGSGVGADDGFVIEADAVDGIAWGSGSLRRAGRGRVKAATWAAHGAENAGVTKGPQDDLISRISNTTRAFFFALLTVQRGSGKASRTPLALMESSYGASGTSERTS